MVAADGWQGPPVVTYAYQQSVLKEEDVLLVNPSQSYPADKSNDVSSSLRTSELNAFAYRAPDGSDGQSPTSSEVSDRPGNCGLYVVCDGHNGVTAAQYVADQLPAYLDDLLPPGGPPPESDAEAFLTWRQGLQRALTISLALIHRAFAGMGMLAGCTVTIVLQHGWLLTCANLGDSRAIVDTGREVTILTDDHRVASHKLERRRLEKRGAVIAPVDIGGGGPAQGKGAIGVGPLRLWPGGLCLSRAIGDFDVGDSVLSLPYICQVRLPQEGARLLVASDGVWDAFEKTSRVVSIIRSAVTQAAPQKVISSIISAHEGIKDDTSLVVVDLLPPGRVFSELTRFGNISCSCIGGPKGGDPEAPRPEVEVLERVDTAHLAGLMPELPEQVPAWFTPELVDELTDTMEQAMDIWEKASGLRRQGRAPSIADFEQLLVAARLEKTSIAVAAAKASMEDMSVRMGGKVQQLLRGSGADGSMFPQSSSAGSMVDANPSVRFGNAVATSPEDFAEKFGHYGRQRHTSLDLGPGPSFVGTTRGAVPMDEDALKRGSAEVRTAYIEGRGNNPYAMRSFPRSAEQPQHSGPAADFSVRAGHANPAGEQIYRTPAQGTAGGGQLMNYSVRGGEAKPIVNPDVVKTFQGSSVPAASPPKTSLLRTSIEGFRRLSVGARTSAGGSDLDVSVGKNSREGSYGRHRRLPKTELQSAMPAPSHAGMPPSALRGSASGSSRVHGGHSTKTVAFSDSARDEGPLADA